MAAGRFGGGSCLWRGSCGLFSLFEEEVVVETGIER